MYVVRFIALEIKRIFMTHDDYLEAKRILYRIGLARTLGLINKRKLYKKERSL